MKNSGAENMDINDELEFNNGVGDALKQKEDFMTHQRREHLQKIIFILRGIEE